MTLLNDVKLMTAVIPDFRNEDDIKNALIEIASNFAFGSGKLVKKTPDRDCTSVFDDIVYDTMSTLRTLAPNNKMSGCDLYRAADLIESAFSYMLAKLTKDIDAVELFSVKVTDADRTSFKKHSTFVVSAAFIVKRS